MPAYRPRLFDGLKRWAMQSALLRLGQRRPLLPGDQNPFWKISLEKNGFPKFIECLFCRVAHKRTPLGVSTLPAMGRQILTVVEMHALADDRCEAGAAVTPRGPHVGFNCFGAIRRANGEFPSASAFRRHFVESGPSSLAGRRSPLTQPGSWRARLRIGRLRGVCCLHEARIDRPLFNGDQTWTLWSTFASAV
jgi:hypothetical protein